MWSWRPAAPGARHGCRSCHQPPALHRDTHGFVLFSSWQQQLQLMSPWLWWLRSGMDISHEHGGSAASSQVMEDWSNPEHPPGMWPLLRLTWTFGLHLKLFIFPLQRSLGALMESVFSSLPGSPLAAQGMAVGGAVRVQGQCPARSLALEGHGLRAQPVGPRGGAGGGDTPVGAAPSPVSSPCSFPGTLRPGGARGMGVPTQRWGH